MKLRTKLYKKYLGIKKRIVSQIRRELGTDEIISHLNAIEDLYIPAAITHQKVFPKYKGINKGKTVVLFGTGPTLDYYTPIEGDVVNIGVNRAYMQKDILLDYLFSADKESDKEAEERIMQYKGNNCKKLIGYRYRIGDTVPIYCREQENAESFYVLSYNYSIFGSQLGDENQFFVFPPDISVAPFKSYGTTAFSAFQFALWTHPDKIYIVGCDCSTGYSSITNEQTSFDYSYLINPWKQAKKFANEYYPDVEIISINPVGLKGIFKDIYTDNYKENVTLQQ